jgi:hypothetical protein
MCQRRKRDVRKNSQRIYIPRNAQRCAFTISRKNHTLQNVGETPFISREQSRRTGQFNPAPVHAPGAERSTLFGAALGYGVDLGLLRFRSVIPDDGRSSACVYEKSIEAPPCIKVGSGFLRNHSRSGSPASVRGYHNRSARFLAGPV